MANAGWAQELVSDCWRKMDENTDALEAGAPLPHPDVGAFDPVSRRFLKEVFSRFELKFTAAGMILESREQATPNNAAKPSVSDELTQGRHAAGAARGCGRIT